MSYLNFLALNALIGGVTGYATNNLAIKMLFKKYFGIGGMIIDTREQFAENVSSLVEREIINNRTIASELEGEDFRNAFSVVVYDFLRRQLYQNTEDIRIGDIPGMEQTTKSLLTFGQNRIDDITGRLVQTLLVNVRVEDLIGEMQRTQLAERFFDIATEVVRENLLISDLVGGLYQENRGRAVSNFISGSVFKKLADNLRDEAGDLHLRLKQDFDVQIDDTVLEMYDRIDILDILANLEKRVRSKTLQELLGPKRVDDVTNEMMDRCIKFIKSEDGQKVVHDFSVNVLNLLKEIKSPIMDLLNEDLQGNFEQLLEKELPRAIKSLITWIKKNKTAIENLIEESLDDVLEEEASGFFNIKGKVKKGIRNIFLPSIAKKYNIVAQIVDAINNNSDVEKLSRQLAKEIISYIKTNSVGKIVTNLEKRRVLTPNSLTNLINRNIDIIVPNLSLRQFDSFFENRVGAFLEEGKLVYFAGDQIKKMILNYVKNDFLYTEKATKLIQREIANRVVGLEKYAVSEIISPKAMYTASSAVEDRMLDECIGRRKQLVNYITEFGHKYIDGLTWNQVLEKSVKEKFIRALSEMNLEQFEQQVQIISEKRIRTVYDRINSIPNLDTRLTNVLLNLINQYLDRLVQGRIQSTVKNKLSELPNDELRKTVEDFMGRELKPITRFGGLLGLLGGLLLCWGQSVYLQAPNLATMVLTPLAAYSLIGWGTNYLALRMIFRPYQKWQIFKWGVPLTPGVMVKQKPRFARSMSEFVDQKLLDQQTVQGFFQRERAKIDNALMKMLTENNHQVIKDILLDNQQAIVNWLLDAGIKHCERERNIIVRSFTQWLAALDLSTWDCQTVKEHLHIELKAGLGAQGPTLEERIVGFLNSERALGTVLPDQVRKILYGSIDNYVAEQIKFVSRELNDAQRISRLVESLAPQYNQFVDKTLLDVLGQDKASDWQSRIGPVLWEKAKSPQVRGPLLDFVQEKLSKEIHPERKVQDLFNGQLMNIFEKNADYILKNSVDLGVVLLAGMKPDIVDTVKEGVEETGGLAKVASRVLDVNYTIEQVVDDLVDDRIPEFLEERKDELRDLVFKIIDKSIATKRVGEIGINLNGEKIKGVIDKLLENPGTSRVVNHLLEGIIGSLFQIPIKVLLRVVSITRINDVYTLFEDNIRESCYELSEKLDRNLGHVQPVAFALVAAIIDRYLLSLSLNQLTSGINREQVGWSVRSILKAIHESQAFGGVLDTGLQKLIDEIKYKPVREIVDLELLQSDMLDTVQQLVASTRFRSDLSDILTYATDLLIRNEDQKVFGILENATVDYIIELLAKSGIDSLEEHMEAIINAVNIRGVTEREINRMDPQQIDDLFDSFARDYFRRLEMYGLSGGLMSLFTNSPILFKYLIN